MKELRTETVIDAAAEAVWRVLVDVAAFPEWNPFIREVTGEVRVGATLRVVLQQPGSKKMVFTPKVLVCDEGRELRWLGHLAFRGLFDGEHAFVIEPLEARRTRFVQSEVFRGLLVPMFARTLDGKTRSGFDEMNLALKERVEALRA